MDTNIVEDSDMRDDMVGMVNEAIRMPHADNNATSDEQNGVEPNGGPNKETAKYIKLLENAQSELYQGCKKFTSLSFIVRLLHIKVLNHSTDKLIDMLLELLNESFPEAVKLPNSYYEAQKITKDLGFTYETLDACPNDCMLFRNEDAKLNECVICGSCRWKHNTENCNGGKKLAVKQVRYFPLKPKLQRWFMSSKIAEHNTEKLINDGEYKHPADSLAWKDFDRRHIYFSSDCRNVRLGLAFDGFNPFRSLNIVHITWPVVLIPYNLPPWIHV